MKYGLIGEKLPYSFSKDIHEMLNNYDYSLNELSITDLERLFKVREFKGINVTIPYKEIVLDYIDYISDEAKEIGAVNTIVNDNNKLIGYNTDSFGFEELLKSNSIDVSGKNVIVLGSGGTSKTVCFILSKLQAKKIVVVSRKPQNGSISYEAAYDCCTDFDIIVNTTPVGMYPDINSSPIDLSYFTNLSAVIDVVYNPINSKLVLSAKEKNIKSVGGLYMLVSQAIHSSQLFVDNKNNFNVDLIYHKVLNSKKNIVLIGMPGSGKSSLGKDLSLRLGKRFIDTDIMIENKFKMSVNSFFDKYGEKRFREEEKVIISEISSLNNCVISTGGGVVLNKENIFNLKHNGLVVYLKRNLDCLYIDDNRPLIHNKYDIINIFNQRSDLYQKYADTIIDCVDDYNQNIIELEKVCYI